ncbi:hypothetical protein Tco_1064998 [Tanacetum coccineum]
MTTANQGMSVEEIEQIVAQRVANAIKTIAIYELINQAKQRENKVAGNASNKRKKERIKPLRVRALVMTIGLDLPKQILNAQIEAQKPENLKHEDVGGMIRKDIRRRC